MLVRRRKQQMFPDKSQALLPAFLKGEVVSCQVCSSQSSTKRCKTRSRSNTTSPSLDTIFARQLDAQQHACVPPLDVLVEDMHNSRSDGLLHPRIHTVVAHREPNLLSPSCQGVLPPVELVGSGPPQQLPTIKYLWPRLLYRRCRYRSSVCQSIGSSDLLDGLNEAQRAAATAAESAVIIKAGVGVGKTSTLLARAAHIVRQGVPPRRLLITSFTNKACEEMMQRITDKCPACSGVNILTVHALALTIVQSFHREAGFPKPVTVVGSIPMRLIHDWWQWAHMEPARTRVCLWLNQDSNVSWSCLHSIATLQDASLHELIWHFPAPTKIPNNTHHVSVRTLRDGYTGKAQCTWRYAAARALFFYMQQKWDPQTHEDTTRLGELSLPQIPVYPDKGVLSRIKKSILFARDKHYQPSEFFVDALFHNIYRSYHEWTIKHCMVDFNGILDAAIRVAQDASIQCILHDTFEHILTDETQDKNDRQIELLRLIDPPFITLVGDPDQVIFSFAGSKPWIFDTLSMLWPTARVIELRENYRSTAAILGTACRALRAPQFQAKVMIAAAQWHAQDCPVELWECAEPNDEARAIADEVSKLIHQGIKPCEICILFRNFAISSGKAYTDLIKALSSRAVLYSLGQDKSVLSGAIAEDLISYCRLVVDAEDDNALERVINEPPRKLGPVFLQHLRETAGAHKCSLFAALLFVSGSQAVQLMASGFHAMIEHIRLAARCLSVDAILKLIVDTTRYVQTSSRRHIGKSSKLPVNVDLESQDECEYHDPDEGALPFNLRVQSICWEAKVWASPVAAEDDSSCRDTHFRPPMYGAAFDSISTTEPQVAKFQTSPVGSDAGLCGPSCGLSILRDFIDAIALRRTSNCESATNRVHISTIHRSKGGEWDFVFNARFNEGFHPTSASSSVINLDTGHIECQMCSGDDVTQHLQEERRLAHVAFSRARRRLVITYIRGQLGGDKVWQSMSLSSIELPDDIWRMAPRSMTILERDSKTWARC